MFSASRHITKLTLDSASLSTRNAVLASERDAAINDLVNENQFFLRPEEAGCSNFHIQIELVESRLRLIVNNAMRPDQTIREITLPLLQLRSVIKDYTTVCEHYEEAIKAAIPAKIEALDTARRSLHNEGAGELQSALSQQVQIDFATARRLFTLVWVLHQK